MKRSIATGVLGLMLWGFAIPMQAQNIVDAPGKSKGGDLQVLTAKPDGTGTNASPLCVVLPPGDGSMKMARQALEQLGKPFAERGWYVLVPVSPDKKPFYGENSAKVRALIREAIKRPEIADQRIVLAGISNGGIAAFQIASEDPNLVACIVAVPGTVWPTVNLRTLMGKPIYYRVGADDQLGWAKNFESHVNNLRRAGAVVDAQLIPKAGHVFEVDWKELDAWLQKVMGKWYPRPHPAR